MTVTAERRMFCKKITESDAFLDMPLSSQALYFHLNMAADDDGFVNNPKKIVRSIGASEDDYKLLIAKRFIVTFESGVIVIKHWKMHNYIQSDRYKPTDYVEEKAMLGIKSNKAYTLDKSKDVYGMDTKCIQDVSVGKVRIGKVSKGNNIKRFTPPTLEEVQAYCKERNNKVDAKAFFDYFTTGGWKDSKGNPVKNWKQKIITWEKYEPKSELKKSNNKFTEMIHTTYDFDEIERKILQ